MLKISLSQQSIKFLKKAPIKHGKQIDRALTALKEQPIPQDSKQLKGTSHYFRVDVGEYRIIYRIDTDNELLIIAMIGKRNDSEVYKKFKRKQQ